MLVSCSVIGPSHQADGLPNQDHRCQKQTDDDRYLIAVADGLGEAPRAHEGSAIAATAAVESLSDAVDSTDGDVLTEESIETAIRMARAAVEREADRRDLAAKSFETTLLVAVAGPERVVGGAIGDGGIVCAVSGEYELLVERESSRLDLEASNITVPLIQSNLDRSIRSNTLEDCDGIAVFSDGLEEFTWDGAGANKEFFDSIFSLVNDHDQPEPAKRKLDTALQNDPYQQFGDDKTITVADLPMSPSDLSLETPGGDQVVACAPVGDTRASATLTLDRPEATALKLFSTPDGEESTLPDKLRAMAENPPESAVSGDAETTAFWPREVVESVNGRPFYGFTCSIPEKNAGEPDASYQFCASAWTGDLSELPAAHQDDASTDPDALALELARLVDRVHTQNHAFGNLYFRTLHFGNEGLAPTECLDMFITGTEETFEREPTRFREQPRDASITTLSPCRRRDRLDLAVIVFRLLMSGVHPFETKETPAASTGHYELVKQNTFLFSDATEKSSTGPASLAAYTGIPEDVRELFERCFNKQEPSPHGHPSAKEWVQALGSS